MVHLQRISLLLLLLLSPSLAARVAVRSVARVQLVAGVPHAQRGGGLDELVED
jgi:hypothetical protein